MTTTVRAVSEISVPVASRTNGHADRAVQDNSPGSRMTYSRFDRSAVSAGVSVLRSGRRPGDFRNGRP
jgi:hypothetical protein